MLLETTRQRLERQLDVIPFLLGNASSTAIMERPASDEWSTHEHLAHLARHHSIFLERLRRITTEDAPELARYRAEEDSSWNEWSSLTTDDVVGRLLSLRAEILRVINDLSEAASERVGIHPVLG